MGGRSSHFCPGCHHGTIHRLVAEALDALGVQGRTLGVASVGCSVFAYDYFTVDFVESPHGRAPAVATGVRRVRPDAFVFTYQGDGDLAAIGTAEIVHAAARGWRVKTLTPQLARQFGLEDEKGVLITGVDGGSIASMAGLQAGDLIAEVDRQRVTSVGELEAALTKAKDKDRVLFLIKRKGGSLFVVLQTK